jgi:hypothetical protein
MLSSNLQALLDNRLRYLPEITGAAINSIDWATKLIVIGKKHGLHVDEMEDFQAVVLKAWFPLKISKMKSSTQPPYRLRPLNN